MIRFDIHNEKIISRCAWMQPDMALGNDKAEISPDGKTGDPVWKVSKFNSSVLRGLTDEQLLGNITPWSKTNYTYSNRDMFRWLKELSEKCHR